MLKSLVTAVLLLMVGSPVSQQAGNDRLLRVPSMSPTVVREALMHHIDGSAAIAQQGLKVHISVDMEGIAGVVDSSHTSSAGRNYAAAREQMIAEANAAIGAAFDAGVRACSFDKHYRPIRA